MEQVVEEEGWELMSSPLSFNLRTGEKLKSMTIASIDMPISEFKQQNLKEEALKHKIRLILKGKLLTDDMTFRKIGLTEGETIHCVLSPILPSTTTQTSSTGDLDEITLGTTDHFLITTSILLFLMWTWFYHFPSHFTFFSITILFGFTVLRLLNPISNFLQRTHSSTNNNNNIRNNAHVD